MTILTTSDAYAIAYCDTLTALVDFPEVTRLAAESIADALTAGGVVPPGAADLTAEANTRAAGDIALDARLDLLENRPRATLYASAAQSALTATWQTITLGAETIDSHGAHAAAAAGFTVPAGQGGVYWIDGLVAFAATTVGATLGTRLQLGATTVLAGPQGPWGSAGGTLLALAGGLVTLAAGDVVTLQGFCSAASWATFGGASPGASTSRLSLHRIA